MIEFYELAKGKTNDWFCFGSKHAKTATHFTNNGGPKRPIAELSLVTNVPDEVVENKEVKPLEMPSTVGDKKGSADSNPNAPLEMPKMDFSSKPVDKKVVPKTDINAPLTMPSTE